MCFPLLESCFLSVIFVSFWNFRDFCVSQWNINVAISAPPLSAATQTHPKQRDFCFWSGFPLSAFLLWKPVQHDHKNPDYLFWGVFSQFFVMASHTAAILRCRDFFRVISSMGKVQPKKKKEKKLKYIFFPTGSQNDLLENLQKKRTKKRFFWQTPSHPRIFFRFCWIFPYFRLHLYHVSNILKFTKNRPGCFVQNFCAMYANTCSIFYLDTVCWFYDKYDVRLQWYFLLWKRFPEKLIKSCGPLAGKGREGEYRRKSSFATSFYGCSRGRCWYWRTQKQHWEWTLDTGLPLWCLLSGPGTDTYA